MKLHNVTLDVDQDADALTPDRIDELMDALGHYHPTLSTGHRGRLAVTISVPAEHVAQAVTTAVAVVEQATGAPVVALEAMSSDEFDARQGWTPLPELVTVTEAAELLNITRQAVLDRIKRHRLPAEKVGRDYAIPRQAIAEEAEQGARRRAKIVTMLEDAHRA